MSIKLTNSFIAVHFEGEAYFVEMPAGGITAPLNPVAKLSPNNKLVIVPAPACLDFQAIEREMDARSKS